MSIFSNIDKTLSETTKVQARQNLISKDLTSPFFTPLLFDPEIVGKQNCENLVAQVSIPVGIVGPVSATLTTSQNTTRMTDFLIPLATTEGALVASIARGCKALNESGNTRVNIKNVGMTRAPVFACLDKPSATRLILWTKNNLTKLGEIGESTSHHLAYLGCQIFQKDNLVFTRFSFDAGDAMGMNMVTIATTAIAEYIVLHNPEVTCPAISSNVCADKKTSSLTRRLGRGRWVTVTCTVPEKLIDSILKTNSTDLLSTYHSKIVVGSRLAGLAGRNMHIANAAAAILTATGQDIAHTVDISQGTLTLQKRATGIFVKLSLPSVPVGTVGGGTSLAAQTTARAIITSQGVTSDILAATIGIAALAGELSGLGALATGALASSHRKLGRL